MNCIFRTLWSVATQSWQAVPETAKSAGKGGGSSRKRASKSSASGMVSGVALGLMASGGVSAQAPPQPVPAPTQLPTGGKVAQGVATLSQTTTAQAAALTVTQSSQRAVVNWDTFNLGSAARINFAQPNAQAITLNRVNDANPSQIFGRITAPGQVVLTNAQGIYFSPTAQVDVGGLVATTHSISDDNFMAGNTRFERNGATGKVVNDGQLNAALGGYIALLAPEVQNAGVIVAQAGTVAMATGDAITLNFAGNRTLASITTTLSTLATLVNNQHAVMATDGQIILSAVALNKLQAGVVKNSGTLEANSLVSKGGKIVLEGDNITLTRTSKLEAKGPAGGGTVLVGGDWQGSGDLRQATKVTMEAGASIDASATDKGDGGKVVLWSDVHNADSVTAVHGRIKAESGPNGGDGGKVETSGHYLNVDDIQVSTQATAGQAGEWLLDPYNITIYSPGIDVSGDYTSTSTSTITASSINAALANGSVTIQTGGTAGDGMGNGDITVNSNISWNNGNALKLIALGSVTGNGGITTGTAASSLTINQAGSSTFGGALSGSGSLIKDGTGTLLFSGNKQYSGATRVVAGTLSIPAASATLPTSTDVILDSAGTLQFSGGPMTVGSLSGSGTLSVTDTGLRPLTLSSNASTTFSGVMAGTALGGPGITKSGTGTFTFTGTSVGVAYGYTINSGVVQVGDGTTSGTFSATQSSSIASGATLVLNHSDDLTANSITGAGTLKLLGRGAVTLGGNGSNLTKIDLTNGTLILNSSTAINPIGVATGTGTISFNGGTLQFSSSNTNDFSNRFSTAAGQSYKINTGTAAAVTLASNLAVAGASLTKSGGGILTLSGANTYDGGTILSAGTLKLGSTTAVGSGAISVASGAALDLNGNTPTNTSLLTLQGTGVSAGGALLNSNATRAAFAGSVALGADASIVSSSGGITLSNTGAISGLYGLTLSGGGLIAGIVGTGTGSLTKVGAGTWTLNGANTYSGGTIITTGTLLAGSASALGSGDISIGSGGALDLNGQAMTSTGLLTLRGTGVSTTGALMNSSTTAASYAGLVALGANSLIVGGTGAIGLTHTGTITGAYGLTLGGTQGGSIVGALGTSTGTLTKQDAGTWELMGPNTYSGGTTLTAGVLQVDAANGLGSGVVSFGGGTLKYGIGANTDYSSQFSTAVNQAYKVDMNGQSVTWATALTSSGGSLTVAGSGTLTVSGANTYSGTTNINGGTLKLGSASPWGSSLSVVTVANGGVLDLNGQSVLATNGLTINGTGISSGGALINSSTNAASFAGLLKLGSASSIVGGAGSINLSNTATITGATFGLTLGGTQGGTLASILGTTTGTLTKTGSGTWVINGANTYTGATAINEGTLKIGAAAALVNGGAVTVASGGVLDLNGQTPTSNFALTINGTGISNGGALINSSTTTASYGGPLTLGSASSIVGDAGLINLTKNGYDLTNPYTLTLGGAQGGALSANLKMGAGSLIKNGAGTWSLIPAAGPTYTGTTTINNGVLYAISASGANALGTGDITVAQGGGLQLSGNLSNAIQLNGGTLRSYAAPATFNGNVTLGAASTTDGNYVLVMNGVISGAYGLTQAGLGGLTLVNTNTYTGNTNITAGTIKLGTTTPWATGAGGTITVSNGAGLDLNGKTVISTNPLTLNGKLQTYSGALTNTYSTGVASYAGQITLGSDSTIGGAGGINLTSPNAITGAYDLTLTATSTAPVNTISSAIATGTGGLKITTLSTANSWLLTGANTYTGNTSVTVGTLKLGTANPWGAGGSVSITGTNAALDLNGQTIVPTNPLTINGTGFSNGGALFNSSLTGASYGGLLTLGSASSIVGETGSITLSNTGTISGAFGLTLGGTQGGSLASILGTTTGTLTKAGTGTWTLGGLNTFTGNTTISAGVLKLGSTTPWGSTGTVSITSGAALDLNGQTVVAGSSRGLTLNGTGIVTGSSNSGVLFNSSSTAASYGGLLTLGSASSIVGDIGSITLSNAGTVSGNFNLTLGGAQGGTFSSILGIGTGTLTKVDTGTWTLGGLNTFTGNTTISAGTLKLGSTTPWGGTGTLSVTSGAALDLNGQTVVAGSARALTLNGTGVSGSGALFNSSSTAASYGGLVTLGSATTILGDTGAISLSNTGTTSGTYALTLGGAQGGTFSSILGMSTGTLTKTGVGTWTLTGVNTYTGSTTINAGTLQVGTVAATTAKLGTGTITANGNLVFIRNAGFLLSAMAPNAGAITGTGNVTVQGNGTVNVDRAITLTGASSVIKVLAGAASGANTSLVSDLTLTSTLTTSATGTIAIFAGSPTATVANGSTTNLGLKMAGATGGIQYKTYNATSALLSSSVVGTRNFYYRVLPSLSVTGATVSATKTYDGNTTATNVTVTGGSSTGSIDGDQMDFSATSANYASASVGTGIGLTVSLAARSSNNLWVVSGYTGSLTGGTVSGTITKAPLVIQANDDARFVTQTDAVGYAGVSYSGFVNNETSSVLVGSAAIARSSPSATAAGSYTLTPSGFTATNYDITYRTGTYTIVPANQLLVRVADSISTYGNTPTYTVTSAKYVMPDNTLVDLTGNLSVTGRLYFLNDGASGNAQFALGLNSPTLSTAGKPVVGIWNVAASGATTTSANFSNTLTVVGTQTIQPRSLTVTASAADKAYDGGVSATVTLNDNRVVGDVLSTSQTAATFASKNAATGLTVTVNGITATGADMGNYSLLNTSATASAAITPKALSLSGLSAAAKVYDGGTSVTMNSYGALLGAVGIDDVQVDATGVSAAFATKTAGIAKTVNISGLILGGADMANYSLANPFTTTANISAKQLTVTGTTVANKVYDATTTATLTNGALQGVVVGDAVTLTQAGNFSDKNYSATSKTVTANDSLLGADKDNYTLMQPTGLTASISKADLSISGVSAVDRTYNATNVASLSGTPSVVPLLTDAVTVSGTPTATFADKNFGTNKPVTVSGYTLMGTDSGNYNPVQPTGLTASISKANLSVTVVTAVDKVYDATTVGALIGTATVAPLLTDNVTVTGTPVATFADKNASVSAIGVGVTGYTLGGTDGGNYNVVQPTGLSALITQKPLLMTGLSAAASKTYDGNNSATVLGNARLQTASAPGAGSAVDGAPYMGDVLTVTGSPTGTYNSKDVAAANAINVTGLSLTGASAGNYTLSTYPAIAALITPKDLIVKANNDANFFAVGDNPAFNGVSYVGFVQNESAANLSFTNGSAPVITSNLTTGVGGQRSTPGTYTGALTPAGVTVGNYNPIYQAGDFTVVPADQLMVRVNNLSVAYGTSSPYGAPTASYFSNTYGLVGGLTVTPTGNAYAVTDALHGVAVTMTLAPVATAGQLSHSGNAVVGTYEIGASSVTNVQGGASFNTVTVTGTQTVTPQALTINATAANKPYDGNNAASVTLASGNALARDVLSYDKTSATFSDKNADVGKLVTVSGLSLSGSDAGNYILQNNSTTTHADITPKQVQLSASKTYDGSTALSGNQLTITTGVGTETLGYSAATISSKNVADNATNTVSSVTLTDGTGGLASNYTYTTLRGTDNSVSLSRANLTLAPVTDTKIYDGTQTSSQAVVVTNTSGSGDVVVAQQEFESKNALGSGGSTLQVKSGYSVVDSQSADMSGNYVITANGAAAGTITPKQVQLSASKTYDGSTALSGNQLTITTGVGTETLGYSAATISSKNVADNATNTVSSVTLTDGTGGLASNYTYTTLRGTDNSVSLSRANLTLAPVTDTKIYDGTQTSSQAVVVTNTSGSGDVVVAQQEFASKNALGSGGSTLQVKSGYSVVDNQSADMSGNYVITASGTAAGTITPKQVQLSASKTYDGSTALSGNQLTITTGVGTETLGYSAATISSKNVADNATNTVSSVTLTDGTGGLASNYTYTTLRGTDNSVSLSRANLTLAPVTDTKIYDGTQTSTQAVVVTNTSGSGDVVVAQQEFASKNALGSGGSTLQVKSGYSVVDNQSADMSGNYVITANGAAAGTITPKALTVANTSVANKVYDGSTTATLSNGILVGVISTDAANVTLTQAGAFADKNVGMSKTVSAANTIAGSEASNYVLTQPTGLMADISQLTPTTGTGNTGSTGGNSIDSGITAVTALTPSQVSALSVTQLAALSVTQTQAFTPSQIAALSAAQIASMPTANLTALTPAQLAVLSANQWMGIPSSLMSSFSTQQLSALSASQLAGLSNSQLSGMTLQQAASLSGSQLSGLTSAQITLLLKTEVTSPNPPVVLPPAVPTPTPVVPVVTAPAFTAPVSTAGLTLNPSPVTVDVAPMAVPAPAPSAATVTPSKDATAPSDSSKDAVVALSVPTSLAATPVPAVTSVNSSSVQITPVPVAAAATSASIEKSGSSSGGEVAGSTSSSSGVVVNTIRVPNRQTTGVVAVLVPKGSSSSGSGMVISLPEETTTLSNATQETVKVSLVNGAALPSWIKYAPAEKGLVLGAVPEGGLPVQVMLMVGNQRTIVQISESQIAK